MLPAMSWPEKFSAVTWSAPFPNRVTMTSRPRWETSRNIEQGTCGYSVFFAHGQNPLEAPGERGGILELLGE